MIYISRIRQKSSSSPNIFASDNVIDAVWHQVSVETSVQALDTLLVYVQRRRYDLIQVDGFIW